MSKKALIIYGTLCVGLNLNVAKDRFVMLPFLPQKASASVIYKKAG